MACIQNQGSPIQKIPLEILLRITYHLTTVDLGNCRLTCRSIEQSLYNSFVLEFFNRKQFMLTDNSLHALVDISKSRLGGHIRYLHFGVDRFLDVSLFAQSNVEKEVRYREYFASHSALWNTGQVVKMLAEALRNLEGLQEVIIRDFNSKSRSRDYPRNEWTSYGCRTILEETGVSLMQGQPGWSSDRNDRHYPSQMFSTLLLALADAKTNIKGFEVMSRHGHHLCDFAFAIPRYTEPGIVSLLQGMEKLYLSVDLSWRAMDSIARPSSDCREPELFLRSFLSHMTNLRDLRINDNHSENRGIEQVLSWLGNTIVETNGEVSATTMTNEPVSGPSMRLSQPVVLLPRLETLSIGFADVEPHLLLNAIERFAPRLKMLELHKIRLIVPPPSSENKGPRPNAWLAFFRRLKEIPDLNLHSIKLSYLQQRDHSVYFVHHNSFNDGPFKSYMGPDWKHFVEVMIPEMTQQFSGRPVEFSSVGEDESADEDTDGDVSN